MVFEYALSLRTHISIHIIPLNSFINTHYSHRPRYKHVTSLWTVAALWSFLSLASFLFLSIFDVCTRSCACGGTGGPFPQVRPSSVLSRSQLLDAPRWRQGLAGHLLPPGSFSATGVSTRTPSARLRHQLSAHTFPHQLQRGLAHSYKNSACFEWEFLTSILFLHYWRNYFVKLFICLVLPRSKME